MPKREHSPLTEEQKDLLRSKFVKLCPLKNACTYCSKIVSSDHIARWASHFRTCKKVIETDKRAYYALGTDPMPASKRKAFSRPMPQAYGDMMGIELVLHASLLHSMREGAEEKNVMASDVTSHLEAQDRAETLAANNFNEINSDSVTSSEIDAEFIGALEKARTYIAATQEQDSMPTENDDSREEPYQEVKRIKREEFEIQEESGKSPSSDDATDHEEHFTGSVTDYLQVSSHELNQNMIGLMKAPLAPAQEC